MFVEEWAKANGYNVHNQGITPWRREYMSNLVNAFDFDNPDYSKTTITEVPSPEKPKKKRDTLEIRSGGDLGDYTGPWVGPAKCQSDYAAPLPPVPYGKANAEQDLKKIV
ncbi:hypothetical protein VHEMI03021 [[Torrubiella] hemipterigena]|uniref:Uncharacterized protein n=1 Tax=[Torrubiella] hemipterigena TaxID=1531966 RepID=A0A0A1T9V8_9HYPO|nr:hypothetical protein VHEMI03021 [[Torrubiella] hemipterigena]